MTKEMSTSSSVPVPRTCRMIFCLAVRMVTSTRHGRTLLKRLLLRLLLTLLSALVRMMIATTFGHGLVLWELAIKFGFLRLHNENKKQSHRVHGGSSFVCCCGGSRFHFSNIERRARSCSWQLYARRSIPFTNRIYFRNRLQTQSLWYH